MGLSRLPPAELGFVRPRSWPLAVTLAIAAGILFKLAMKAVVMPLLGAPPVNAHYHYLEGNAAALPGMLFAVVVGAGFSEELLYRGFLFERLGRLWGRGLAALAGTVLLTATLFAAAHYPDQGVPGVQQAAVFGLVFGAVYARRREIVTLMVAHAAFDITAVVLIYQGWENAVAQWLW